MIIGEDGHEIISESSEASRKEGLIRDFCHEAQELIRDTKRLGGNISRFVIRRIISMINKGCTLLLVGVIMVGVATILLLVASMVGLVMLITSPLILLNAGEKNEANRFVIQVEKAGRKAKDTRSQSAIKSLSQRIMGLTKKG